MLRPLLAMCAAHPLASYAPQANILQSVGCHRSRAVADTLQWYVDQAMGMGQPLELFYSDARCKDAYKTYVAAILGRRNTINGVPYASDGAGASQHHHPSMCAQWAPNQP
jgi:hypothetical protein